MDNLKRKNLHSLLVYSDNWKIENRNILIKNEENTNLFLHIFHHFDKIFNKLCTKYINNITLYELKNI